MTHYEIDYSKMPVQDENEKDAQALRDMVEYMSEGQWTNLLRLTLQERLPLDQLDRALHIFVGVSGYPVFAFFRTLRPDDYQAWYDSLPD